MNKAQEQFARRQQVKALIGISRYHPNMDEDDWKALDKGKVHDFLSEMCKEMKEELDGRLLLYSDWSYEIEKTRNVMEIDLVFWMDSKKKHGNRRYSFYKGNTITVLRDDEQEIIGDIVGKLIEERNLRGRLKFAHARSRFLLDYVIKVKNYKCFLGAQ